MSKTIIYLARHAETLSNIKEILQGQQDSPLSDNGIDQAQQLAKKLNSIKFDLIFSSDLGRAKHTARILAKPHGLKVKTSRKLREMFFGKYEGWEAKRFDKTFAKKLAQRHKLPDSERMSAEFSPEIEIDEAAADRVLRFLQKTAIKNPGKTILTVSHGAVIRVFLIKIGWGSYQELSHGAIENCSYVVVETDGTNFKIIRTNEIEKN